MKDKRLEQAWAELEAQHPEIKRNEPDWNICGQRVESIEELTEHGHYFTAQDTDWSRIIEAMIRLKVSQAQSEAVDRYVKNLTEPDATIWRLRMEGKTQEDIGVVICRTGRRVGQRIEKMIDEVQQLVCGVTENHKML